MAISDGVKVLLITSACYVLTYSFELGYFRYFDIPTELIDISLKSLLTFGMLFLSISLLCIVPGANLVSKIIYEKRKEDPNLKFNVTLLMYGFSICLYIIYTLIFYHVTPLSTIVLQITLMLVLAANDILTPFMYKRGRTLSESVEDFAIEQSKSDVITLFSKTTKTNTKLYMAIFLLLLYIAHVLGGFNAKLAKLDLTCNGNVIYETQGSTIVIKPSINKFKIVPIDSCVLERVIKK